MSTDSLGNRGFALVLTMVVSALMVAVVVEMIHQVYVDVSISRGFRDVQQASLHAESGITGGVKLLQSSLSGQEYSALTDVWARPLRLDDETGTIEISATDENARININDLVLPNGEFEPFTLAALKRLGRRLQMTDDIWNALADWIDGDDQMRPEGGEAAYYSTLKPPYQPRNGKLATFSELSMVRGFTPEIMERLRPYVTVYSGQTGISLSRVNINTAPREVLAALDDSIDDRMADRIIEERLIRPFRTTGELSRIPGGEVLSQKLAGKVGVKGTLFLLTSVARVKESARTVEARVRLGGSAPETLSWQEY